MSSIPESTSPDNPAAPHPARLGVLGSGAGTNYAALADAVERGELKAKFVIAISDASDAGLLKKAQARGVPAHFIDPGPWQTKMSDSAQEEMARRLVEAGAEFVICAGFMRRLKDPVLKAFPQRILNIHPSLLPQFPGRDAIGQALAAGVTETGCTVHLVNEEIDSGDVLAQEKVPVQPGDTHAALLARLNAAEHRLYPRAIAEYVKALALRI